MNEIGWWILALFMIVMLSDFLEKRKPEGVSSMDHKIGCAMLFGFLILLWGGAGIIRLLFF